MTYVCYDCDLAGEPVPAEQQLGGRWLCRRHLDEWREKPGGVTVLLALSREGIGRSRLVPTEPKGKPCSA